MFIEMFHQLLFPSDMAAIRGIKSPESMHFISICGMFM